jgi:hypothetical protein
MSMNAEPFQRTDIGMKPLGPTILEVLNCGFHKRRGEKTKVSTIGRREEQIQ